MGGLNSGRRPTKFKTIQDCRRLIAEHAHEAVELLIRLTTQEDVPLNVRVDCAKYLLDQHMGRPPQRVKLSGDEEDGAPINVRVRIQ